MNSTKSATKLHTAPKILKDILTELRILRSEMALIVPHEDIADFAHPRRIRRSYENALKRYPPSHVWK